MKTKKFMNHYHILLPWNLWEKFCDNNFLFFDWKEKHLRKKIPPKLLNKNCAYREQTIFSQILCSNKMEKLFLSFPSRTSIIPPSHYYLYLSFLFFLFALSRILFREYFVNVRTAFEWALGIVHKDLESLSLATKLID